MGCMKKETRPKILQKYLFANKGNMVFLILIKLLNALFQTGVSLLIYYFLDALSKGCTLQDALWMGLIGLLYIAVCAIFIVWNFYLSNKTANHALKAYKDDVVRRILFDTDNEENTEISSRSLTLIQKDVEHALDTYFLPCLDMISYSFTFVSALVISMILNPILASVMLALAVVVVLVPNLYSRPLAKQRNELSDENLSYSSFLGNAFRGKRVLQNGNAEERFAEKNNEETFRVEKKQNRLWKTYGYENGSMYFFVMFLEIGSFFLAGILYLNNMCTLSVSVALLSISSDIYNPLTQIVSSALEMRSYRDVLTKIEKIPNPSTSATEEKQLENNAPDLTLSHLTIRFQERVLLEDVSCSIPFGSKVLITGESGSGKTTLFECLLGYRKPEGGKILFITEEGKKVSPSIAYCPQTPTLFLGTLQENITLFAKPDKKRLEEVIHSCGLESFVEKRGFDTTLNDFDNKISLGEMQRISLARALYLNREILLLDEVTSSLDKENTDIILQSLKEIKDKTIILISHQLKNVEDISFDYHYQFQDKKLELVEERK